MRHLDPNHQMADILKSEWRNPKDKQPLNGRYFQYQDGEFYNPALDDDHEYRWQDEEDEDDEEEDEDDDGGGEMGEGEDEGAGAGSGEGAVVGGGSEEEQTNEREREQADIEMAEFLEMTRKHHRTSETFGELWSAI